MSVTREEVLATAKLAHLELSETEVKQLEQSMTKIVYMFDELGKVCTEKVKHLDILPKRKLEELPEQNPSITQQQNMADFAIEFDKDEFLVPKVIDEEE